jgi:hypothetical protein
LDTTAITIHDCTEPAELYCRYDGEFEPQGAYIELGLESGTLSASYNAVIGSAIPFEVHHGFVRRYSIPILTAAAANRAMREIAPLAARIVADWESQWDGRNHRAVLGADAKAADEEIDQILGANEPSWSYSGHWSETDLVAAWDPADLERRLLIDEYGITGATTDARLEQIAKDVVEGLATCTGTERVTICPGIEDYLRELRDDLAEDDTDD